MPDEPVETPEETPETPPEGDPQPETFDADYVAKLRKEAAKYRTDAKKAATELEKVKESAMTEADKAVAEAEKRGRQEAASDFGRRLARKEFDALAGRRNRDFDTESTLDLIDLSRFIGDDGEPDTKAITVAVERLVPEPVNGPPSLDGGARTTPPAPAGMNSLIRTAAGRT